MMTRAFYPCLNESLDVGEKGKCVPLVKAATSLCICERAEGPGSTV